MLVKYSLSLTTSVFQKACTNSRGWRTEHKTPNTVKSCLDVPSRLKHFTVYSITFCNTPKVFYALQYNIYLAIYSTAVEGTTCRTVYIIGEYDLSYSIHYTLLYIIQSTVFGSHASPHSYLLTSDCTAACAWRSRYTPACRVNASSSTW